MIRIGKPDALSISIRKQTLRRFKLNLLAASAMCVAALILTPSGVVAQGTVSFEIQRAETLIAQGDYVEALAAVRSASASAPSDYRIRYYSAMALLGLQRFDEARTEAELALSLAPGEDRPSVERLMAAIDLQSVSLTAEADAEAALASGLTGRAARLFAQAFDADNSKSDPAFRAAEIYAGSMGQPVDAVKILRRVEAQSPDSAARERAKRELDRLASVVRPFVDDLLIKAMARIDAGDASGAEALVTEASELDPERREVVIEKLRLSALGNDGRALEADFLGLASKNIKIESVMPVLPRSAYWAEQAWMRELLEDYQGAEYARKMLNYLRMDKVFRDCASCPELMLIPPGRFTMGERWRPEGGTDGFASPPRDVQIGYALAVGRYPVTWDEYDVCVADGVCQQTRVIITCGTATTNIPGCPSEYKRRSPHVTVLREPFDSRGSMRRATWNDANVYATWLSRKTGQTYRLLSEAEWEYVARAGTTTRHYWGDHRPNEDCQTRLLNSIDYSCAYKRSGVLGANLPVGAFLPNPWGIYDLIRGDNWLLDCYTTYDNSALKNDGSAYVINGCSERASRGFSSNLGTTYRNKWPVNTYCCGEIRVAREVPNL